jgi:hypothetical protein
MKGIRHADPFVSCFRIPQPDAMTKDISDRLIGTLAADETGRPLVLHHGTFEAFTEFSKSRDIGFHFGSREQAAARQSQKARELKMKVPGTWRVMKVALAVHNVLVFPDDPADWTNWHAITALSRLVDPDFLSRMRSEGVTESKVVARKLRSLLIELGYDAIVYRNMYESTVGANAAWSWLVLDSRSIISLPATFADSVLDDAVGADPGLVLPRQTSDIQGARGKNGRIRLQRDRKALLAALEELATENGGSVGDAKYAWEKGDEGTYLLDFGDGFTGEVTLGIGRVKIDIPASSQDAFAEIVDDFVSYVGIERPATDKLIYEWIPGETSADFMERLGVEIRAVKDLAATHGVIPGLQFA